MRFIPHHFRMPQNSSRDQIIQAAKDLTHALNNPSPEAPFHHVGSQEKIALKQIAEILLPKNKESQNKNTNDNTFQRVKKKQPLQRVKKKSPLQRVKKKKKKQQVNT